MAEPSPQLQVRSPVKSVSNKKGKPVVSHPPISKTSELNLLSVDKHAYVLTPLNESISTLASSGSSHHSSNPWDTPSQVCFFSICCYTTRGCQWVRLSLLPAKLMFQLWLVYLPAQINHWTRLLAQLNHRTRRFQFPMVAPPLLRTLSRNLSNYAPKLEHIKCNLACHGLIGWFVTVLKDYWFCRISTSQFCTELLQLQSFLCCTSQEWCTLLQLLREPLCSASCSSRSQYFHRSWKYILRLIFGRLDRLPNQSQRIQCNCSFFQNDEQVVVLELVGYGSWLWWRMICNF